MNLHGIEWQQLIQRFLHARGSRVFVGVLFFISIYIFVCGFIRRFGVYASHLLNLDFIYDVNSGAPLVCSLLFFGAYGVLNLINADELKDKNIHHIPYFLFFITVAFSNVGMFFFFLVMGENLISVTVIPVVMTTITLLLWGTTVVRFRARTLRQIDDLSTSIDHLSTSYDKATEDKLRAQQEALRAERFKTELITNVSHDIRTPLTSIINYVDLIDRLQIDHAELQEYVHVLKRTSNRLKILINDLLDASKAGSGNVVMDVRPLDLTELLGQLSGEFETVFDNRALTYVSRVTPGPMMVLADGQSLWRVMENLFNNFK
jgi:signal transduction histidine kinase